MAKKSHSEDGKGVLNIGTVADVVLAHEKDGDEPRPMIADKVVWYADSQVDGGAASSQPA